MESKKKKPPQNDNKPPRITIADVMQTSVEFQSSVDQRFNKLESSVEQRFNKMDQRLKNFSDRVGKIEKEVFKK